MAGISLSLVLGNNGIITKAKESRTETRMAQIDEQVNLAIGDAYTDGIGSITDSGLKTALNNRIGEGTYDINGDETTGWKVTVKETGKTYEIAANGETSSSVNWEEILKKANEDPESFKDKEQNKTNDIGIGTDGLPVNLDLWKYRKINVNEIALSTSDGSNSGPGYLNENIKDGKIQGKIPQFIKFEGNTEFYEVTSIVFTFAGCVDLEEAPDEFPRQISSLNNTFYGCTKLKNVPTIPSSVTSMGSTFSGCANLEKIPVIPNNVTDLGRTFYGCEKLLSVPEIPKSVTYMYETFYDCTSLVNAPVINANITTMVSTFENCESLINAPKIPEKVNDIRYAFKGCTKLENAPEIPEGVISMDYAFYECTNLRETPQIPDEVYSMDYAFYGCTNLETAHEIPSSVHRMESTFENCINLTGTIVINAGNAEGNKLNVVDETNCFKNTVKPIILKGDSRSLEFFAATATNGNVTVQTTSE